LGVALPGGHVGNDDVITGPKALRDLDAVAGNAAENDLDALRLLPIFGNLVEQERASALGLQRPLEESRQGDFLDLDGTAGRKVKAVFPRLRADETSNRC
jgi:hypothetical protein